MGTESGIGAPLGRRCALLGRQAEGAVQTREKDNVESGTLLSCSANPYSPGSAAAGHALSSAPRQHQEQALHREVAPPRRHLRSLLVLSSRPEGGREGGAEPRNWAGLLGSEQAEPNPALA